MKIKKIFHILPLKTTTDTIITSKKNYIHTHTFYARTHKTYDNERNRKKQQM